MKKSNFQFIFAVAIVSMWAMAVLLTVFDDGQPFLRIMSAPFGLVIGWAFGAQSAAQNGKS